MQDPKTAAQEILINFLRGSARGDNCGIERYIEAALESRDAAWERDLNRARADLRDAIRKRCIDLDSVIGAIEDRSTKQELRRIADSLRRTIGECLLPKSAGS